MDLCSKLPTILIITGLICEIYGVYRLGRTFLMKKGYSLIKKIFKLTYYHLTLQNTKAKNETEIFRLPKLDIKTNIYEAFMGFFWIFWGFLLQIGGSILSLLA